MSDGKFSPHSNPTFGEGCFYRRIRLLHEEGRVEAQLEDSSHAFSLTLYYSAGKVARVDAQAHRFPLTTCPGAVDALAAFEGQAIGASWAALNRALNARENCTHLFDLTVLAVAHAKRPLGERVYDVVLPDETDRPVTLSILRDGESVLAWEVKDWTVKAPQNLHGNPLHSGFTAWWQGVCGDDDELFECGVLAQRGYLVSHARRYDHSVNGGKKAESNPAMLGICHSYSTGTIEEARYTHDSFRDFSARQETLLQCFD